MEDSSSTSSSTTASVVAAPFLIKTYQLVDDPATNHIISWGEDDSTFVIWRPPEFSRDLLPTYFKHNNFSSFVRQLNTYGFRKIIPNRWEFGNQLFRKGAKHLLCGIHRRKPPSANANANPNTMTRSSPASSEDHDHATAFMSMPILSFSHDIACYPPRNEIASFQSLLREENTRLRSSNSLLLSELCRMRNVYKDVLIYLIQRHIKIPLKYNHPNHVIAESLSSSSSSSYSMAPTASTLSFVDGKLKEAAQQDNGRETKSTVKLFGVSLYANAAKKRSYSSIVWDEGKTTLATYKRPSKERASDC